MLILLLVKKQLLFLKKLHCESKQSNKADIKAITAKTNANIIKNVLLVIADINNNTETKEQEVKGVTKPNVEVTTDGSSNFVIKASDEEGIKRIEIILNETEKSAIDLDKVYPDVEQRKQFEYNQIPIRDGENRLEVKVYNESGVSETARVLVNK